MGKGAEKPKRRTWLPSFVLWNLLAKETMAGSLSGVKTRVPAKTGSGCGKAWNVKEVTTPKFAPAPRMAQKRSGFWVVEAVMMELDARTSSTDWRLSVYVH
jgi:hypothetical protein